MMSGYKTIFICLSSLFFYDYYKNNPNDHYVKLIKLHIDKSIKDCPFIKKIKK